MDNFYILIMVFMILKANYAKNGNTFFAMKFYFIVNVIWANRKLFWFINFNIQILIPFTFLFLNILKLLNLFFQFFIFLLDIFFFDLFDHISPAGGATKEACQRSTTAAMETATAMAIQQMKMKIVKSYLLLVENVHL